MMTLAVVVCLATVISIVMPKTYVATSSIVIDFRGSNPVDANAPPPQLYPSYIATQLDIIASQAVGLKVVDELSLLNDPAAQKRYLPLGLSIVANYVGKLFNRVTDESFDWSSDTVSGSLAGEQTRTAAEVKKLLRYRLAEELLKRLALKPSQDSSVVKVSYSAADPDAAANAANAFVRAYIATNLELNVSPARHSSEWFNEQTKFLADTLAKARTRYSTYQQATGIIATDEPLDVESTRLAELSSQLVGAQADNHPGIQQLQADLARAEARLNDLPHHLGVNHPQYRNAQTEVSNLRSKLAAQTHRIASTIQAQIAAQRAKVLQMKKQRGELAMLKSDVDSAQHALDEAMNRSNRVRMESQMNQTNVSVVREAVPPLKATSPKLLLNISVALFAGCVIAVGLALWREMAHRYVRCKEDLQEVLGTPVLGILPASGRFSLRQLRSASPDVAHLS
jgi:uncharacterized protein involved in exopolysaccharide biosynthesis